METMAQKRVYSCWMLIEPAEDVPGLWVSHCLNFDVIAQGENPLEALESLREAVTLMVSDDLLNGRDPQERVAPEEEWNKLARIMKNGKPVKLSELKPDQKVLLATNETVVFTYIDNHPAVNQMPQIATSPVAYQPAA
ncbi:MAG TPA: hypothetical protein VGF94_13340 [Kofleriaceae bacterium]